MKLPGTIWTLDPAPENFAPVPTSLADGAAFTKNEYEKWKKVIAVVQRERPELIVMDPPRAGVGAEVCALLARISSPEIVYVSCDPVTLARDLKLLVAAGYNIAEVHMVDMFPQTFHLETVAILRR